ncbi:MAG: hypothetical protein AB7S75_15405 [Desulfococcaceae bacterium]
MIPWHRLFGLTLTDYFFRSAYEVELEKDLSLKQQLLDVVITRKREGEIPDVLPEGLENLVSRNLMTYKSHQESLDGWTVEELIGHYANYRKQVSPSLGSLLPEEDFRLYAVSTRHPEKLAEQTEFREVCPGVYDVKWGIRDIRIIVLSRITESEKNSPWLMFSAVPDKVEYGAENYKWQTPVSGIMNRLFEKYRIEGITMPYTINDYLRETKEEVLGSLTPEDIDRILKNLRPEEIFKKFRPEDRLKGLRPEDRLKGLRPEDRLKGLSPEEIEEYLNRIRQKKSS